MIISERLIKQAIRKWIQRNWLGAWIFMPVQSGMGMAGVPDFIVCKPTVVTQEMVGKTIGVLVGIEAKREGGKPTPLQLKQLHGISDAKGVAVVVAGPNAIGEVLGGIDFDLKGRDT